MTLVDIETHMALSQGSLRHVLTPISSTIRFKSIAPRQVAFSHDFAEILSEVVSLITS